MNIKLFFKKLLCRIGGRISINLSNGLKITVMSFTKGDLMQLRRAYRKQFKCNDPLHLDDLHVCPKDYAGGGGCYWSTLGRYKDFYVITFHFERKLHVIISKEALESSLEALLSDKPEDALKFCMTLFIGNDVVYRPFNSQGNLMICDSVGAADSNTVKLLQTAIINNLNPEISALLGSE